jgi:hypothetical protein
MYLNAYLFPLLKTDSSMHKHKMLTDWQINKVTVVYLNMNYQVI